MKCINCDKETSNPRFCSKSCAAQTNNKKFPKRQKIHTEKKFCLFCNLELLKSSQIKYCGSECTAKAMINRTNQKIVNGEIANTNQLKRYLKETTGYQCSMCGNTGHYNGKILTLQLDHIDGNSDNNLPNNLRLLCPNCHSQTETWVSRNKKKSKRNLYLQKYKFGRYKNGRLV